VKTLVELVRDRAFARPDDVAFTQWAAPDGELAPTRHQTFSQLHDRAARVAALVAELTEPADRVVLVVMDQLSFVAAFLGTQLAGRVPVPASPPSGASGSERLILQIADSRARLVLLDPLLLPYADAFAGTAGWEGSVCPVTDADEREPWAGDRRVTGSDLAFLQYTSGSTSAPKGVRVTHDNVLANERLIAEGFGHGPDTVMASWLPSFHDMGLIGGILQPLYLGVVGHLMAPADFLDRPLDWLRMVDRSGATTSGSPNFGYDLCVRRSTEEERAALDLSRWRVAFNGAEPVSATTLDRFAAAFAASGYQASAAFPCYGLAEATLFVTGARPGEGAVVRDLDRRALESGRAVPATGRDTVEVVSSGPDPHGLVRIAGPDDLTPCPEGTVGEVLVTGPSVTGGYWRQQDATTQVYVAGAVRTGDLGFLLDGELHITGRVEDLIIVRGRNVHPQDVEAAVVDSGVPVRRAGVVAVGRPGPEGETEVVVLAETTAADRAAAWVPVLREAVARSCDLAVTTVVLCPPSSLPHTTSGKKQRSASLRAWVDGTLAVLVVDRLPACGTDPDPGATGPRVLVAEALGMAERELPADVPLVALGLDSVRAAGLALTLREAGFGVTARELLTAGGLDELLDGLGEARTEVATPGPDRVGSMDGAVRASVTQEVFWARAERFPEDPAPTQVRVLELVDRSGPGAARELCEVVGTLVRRHPALHTRLVARSDRLVVEPVGVLLADPVPRPVPLPDEAAVHRYAATAAATAVDLGARPGARLEVLLAEDGRVFLLEVAHHAATDLWSLVRLVTETLQLLAGVPVRDLPQVGPGTGRHAAQQHALTDGPRLEEWSAAWRARLDGVAPLALPPGTGHDVAYAVRPVAVEAPVLNEVRRVAGSVGVTPFVVLLACLHRVLGVYSGTDDTTVAVPFHGRTAPAWRHELGCFLATLPVRVAATVDLPFPELLRVVDAAVADAETRQDLPIAVLGSGRPVGQDQVGFVLQGFADPAEQAVAPLAVPGGSGRFRAVPDGPVLALHPVPRVALEQSLVLTLVDTGGRLEGAFELDPSAVDVGWVDALVRAFPAVVADLCGTVGGTGRSLAGGTREVLVREGGAAVLAGAGVDAAESVLQSVLRLAEQEPGRAAVEHEGRRTSRAELVAHARRAADRLRAEGVGRGDVVGVWLPPSDRRVAWVLGTWLAGATYLPLDVDQPPARLAEMVEEARCARVVWEAGGPGEPSWCEPGRRLRTDEPSPGTDDVRGAEALPRLADAAYVLFTSGTSGRPKGALLEHGGLASVAASQRRWFGLGADDRVLAYTAHSFDAAIFETVLALGAGATLVVPTPEEREVDALGRTLRRRGITAAVLTPSVVAYVPGDLAVPQLDLLVLAGEELPPSLAAHWAGRTRLFDLYGPTECTIWTTGTRIGSGDRITIGAPIENVTVEVLDEHGNVLPRFAVGELAVKGATVGRGYLRDDGRPPGFETVAGGRRYRTGDLVRLGSEGRLEYRGRRDQQVKVRGVRVELREIEERLRARPGVADAVALVDGADRLVVAVRPDTGVTLDGTGLRAALLEHLPLAMVPQRVVVLAAFPFDRHGKVDRSRLLVQTPVAGARSERIPDRGPTPLERTVAAVATAVLGRDVDPQADLVDLGLTSVDAARLVGRLRDETGRGIRVPQVYACPTVPALAALFEQQPDAPGVPPVGRSRPGEPASAGRAEPDRIGVRPTQREILLAQRLGIEGKAYHVPVAMEVTGDLDPAALTAAVEDLERLHPALRARTRDDELVVHPPGAGSGLPVRFVDVRYEQDPGTAARAALAADAEHPFDLDASGPVRLTVARTEDDAWLLGLVAHHALVDGWSVGVLLGDLGDAYAARRAGVPWSPGPAPTTDPQPARPASEWADLPWPRSPLRLAELPQGSGTSVLLERPVTAQTTRALRVAARSAGVTPFALVLSAWFVVLARRTGRNDLVTATVLGSRDAESWRTVGCVASTVAVPMHVERGASWAELARKVAGRLDDALDAPGLTDVARAAGLGAVAGSALMQTLVVQGDREFWSLELAGCLVRRIPSVPSRPKSELAVTFTAGEERRGGQVALEYDAARFSPEEAEAWLDQLEAAIAVATADVHAGVVRAAAEPGPGRASGATSDIASLLVRAESLPPGELRARPRAVRAGTVVSVTTDVTDTWCATAEAGGGTVLRLCVADGVVIGHWAERGSRLLRPIDGVTFRVVGELGRAVAMWGYGELVADTADRADLRTGRRARRVPRGVECRGELAAAGGGGVDPTDLIDALERGGTPVLALDVARCDARANHQLFCFVVTDAAVDEARLRRVLAAVLPSSALPDRVVPVLAIPVDPLATATALHQQEPHSALLPAVTQAWERVLGRSVSGADVSFFDAGGTSAQVIALQDELGRSTGVTIGLAALFEHPTVRHQARHLAGLARTGVDPPAGERTRRPAVRRARRGTVVTKADRGVT
jgi:amino acid adenylation domain-containing protein